MTRTALKYFDIIEARQAYAAGRNVTELLRQQKHVDINTPDIIEAAYDLQAGSYIEHVRTHADQVSAYATELAAILDRHVGASESLLDVGTGELTTLSQVVSRLRHRPSATLAFDISWSRVHHGIAHARQTMGPGFDGLQAFVADMSEIPLQDKSVSVTTSSHALEPNGGRVSELLAELFRVTRDMLVLFEPSYELNSPEGQARMDRLGYIKGIDAVVAQLGGTLLDKIRIQHVSNPLNPTVCHVIRPSAATQAAPVHAAATGRFSVPGTNLPLELVDGFQFSRDTGLCFPVLKGIPILKSSAAILATALSAD